MDNRTYMILGIEPDLADTPIVSVVGAGGKTTLIFQIADEISADGHGDVIICGTTRFTRKNHSYSVISYADWMDSTTSHVVVSGVANRTVVLSGTLPADSKGRYSSINDDQIAKLVTDPSVAAVIVNADGSRMKPFKAPKPGEPVLASGTSHVLGLIGADLWAFVSILIRCIDPKRLEDSLSWLVWTNWSSLINMPSPKFFMLRTGHL